MLAIIYKGINLNKIFEINHSQIYIILNEFSH